MISVVSLLAVSVGLADTPLADSRAAKAVDRRDCPGAGGVSRCAPLSCVASAVLLVEAACMIE